MQTVRLELLRLEDGDRVLDLGCGEGRHIHAAYYAARCHAVGLDLGFDEVASTRDGFGRIPDMEENSGRRFSLLVGDATRLPFEEGSFDKVICSEVLEHIPDYKMAIREIRRVVKPGGTVAISVPRTWPEWICWKLAPNGYPKTPGGHIRIFRASALTRDVENEGLVFFRRHWAHGLHSPYWWLQCLLWSHKETSRLVRLYHRLLVWDITRRPWLTRALEKVLDPLMGKSVVLYFAAGARR